MRPLILFAAILLLPHLAMSQFEILSEEMKRRFPDESVVFLNRSMTLTLFIENDSLKGYSDINEDLLHLKGQTEHYTRRKVYGSSFVRVDKLQAKTLVWERNRYREVPVKGWTKNSDTGDNVFYDDGYYYSCNYPSVASGNRTQIEYREIHKDIRLIPGYLISSYAPQARSSFTIKTTKDVDLYFEVLNDKDKLVQFSKREKGNNVTYEWTAENVATAQSEEQGPALKYYEPHIVWYVRSYTTKNKTISVLPDLNALNKWYRTFTDHLDEPPSSELVSIVDSLKQSSKSELETVKKIFHWVQSNIQYIAFEDGMRGFVPHKASFTCEKRYGDCKDMATLIVGMLKVAGIKAFYTWIGTRDIPYRYSKFPLPIVDNHMIATYVSPEGNYYFLDGTGKYTPFGFPTAMIQGKEALISIDAEKYEVREVPIITAKDNVITDSVAIRIENNAIVGTGRFGITGLSKASVGYEFGHVEEKDTRNFVIRIAGKGSNKFLLDQYRFENQFEIDKPTTILYDFRLPDYCQSLSDELYINLHLRKDNYNRYINNRKTPHESEYVYEKADVVDFTIPEGFEVEYLPPNDKFDGKLLHYSISYEALGNRIILRKAHYVDYLLLEPSQFNVWNEEVSKLSNAYQETVILKKKSK